MHVPRIEIYINEKSGISIAHVKDVREPLTIDFVLPDGISAGEDELATAIGKAFLAILKLWNPDILKELPAQAPLSPAEIKTSAAHELLRISFSEKTDWYVDAIDKLFTEASVDLGTDFLVSSWPTLRAQLESFKTDR